MKNIILFMSFCLISVSLNAQFYGGGGGSGIKPMASLNKGDVKLLNDVKIVNIIFDYSEMGVGAFRKEEDYLNKRQKELNDKEAGKGDKMVKAWNDAKKAKYEPQFEELFKKYAPKDLQMDGNLNTTNAEYTMLVKTVFIEPGVNVGVFQRPAYADMECTFKDKNDKVLCMFFVKNAVGAQAMGFDFDVSSRVVESYGKAAKMLVAAIKKERKKAVKK